jgi:hypothetical protein
MLHDLNKLAFVLSGVWSIALVAIGFILRFLIERSHDKEMELVKAGYSKELEHLRSELHRQSIRVSRFHEEQALAITALYDQLLKVRDATTSFISQAHVPEGESNRFQVMIEEDEELLRLLERKRIYVDEVTVELLRKAEEVLGTAGVRLMGGSLRANHLDPAIRDTFVRQLEASRDAINRDFEAALQRLQEQCKRVLGGTDV